MQELRIGVVGYCPPSVFKEDEAQHCIEVAFCQIAELYPNHRKTVVSGLTNLGVLAIAYAGAVRRGWRTAGITSRQALRQYPDQLFPVDACRIIGEKWGDESAAFLADIDVLVRVGGGSQSRREAEEARRAKKFVLEFEVSLLNV